MSLTPLDGDSGTVRVFPVDIPYSALVEDGPMSSTQTIDNDMTVAVTFKPTTVNDSLPFGDSRYHHHVVINYVHSTKAVTLWVSGTTPTGYITTKTTAAELLQEALVAVCGSARGYYSNLYVVDGASLDAYTFFELSTVLPTLWVWKSDISVTYGPNGGYYPFTYGTTAVGANIFTGGVASGSTYIQPPSRLFDDTLGTYWVTGNNDGYADYAFGESIERTLRYYVIQTAIDGSTSGWPKSWLIQGSNNGVDWTTVDTVTGLTLDDWSPYASHRNTYVVDNPGAYHYYRLQMVEANASYNNAIDAWEGYDSGTPFGLGTDFSGNENHWSVTGTQSTDTPTNNLPIINPVPDVGWTLSEGNLAFACDPGSDFMKVTLPCVDKCYWEVEWIAAAGGSIGVIGEASTDPKVAGTTYLQRSGEFQRFDDTEGTFDLAVYNVCTLMLAYDNGNLWIGVNGVWSGDPVAFTGPIDSTINDTVYPFAFNTFSTNTPAGRFKFAELDLTYSVPAGYKPLKEKVI